MTSPDLRGFRYGLAAARERAGHCVDAAVAVLGACQQALSQAQAQHSELEAALQAQAMQCRPAPGTCVQPALAACATSQLRSLQARIAAAREDIGNRRQALDEARQGVQEAQARREAFERHRTAALEDFQRDAARASQAALDDDWLARSCWLGAGHPGSDRKGTR